ncbi:MAG: hypothetical protein JXR72_06350 [Proteobacteria bacterium]|nr:hypothetical protein [Pseudomonadota bacterium]
MDEIVSLTCGKGRIILTIPSENLAGPVISPRQPEEGANPDVADAISRALDNPLGTPRLRDLSRETPGGVSFQGPGEYKP